MEKYTTISLPYEFHERISRFIKENSYLGYGSVAEFAKEAIRIRLADVKADAAILALRELRDKPYKNWEEKWKSFRDISKK